MTRVRLAAIAGAAIVLFSAASALAADGPPLAGRWTLNRALSQFPRGLGFGMDLVSGPGSTGGGGRGGSEAASLAMFRETEEDARRRERLVDAVQNPSPHLTIAETATAITMTDDQGRSLTFHPDGKDETQAWDQVQVVTSTRWEGTRLVVRYKVEQNRELRYTFSRTDNPAQLVVQVQFVERGNRDTVTRVYEPTRPNEEVQPKPEPPKTPEIPGITRPQPQAGVGAPAASPTRPAGIPQTDRPAVPGGSGPIGTQKPDAELKGLTDIGVVVEDLSSQAAACGLSQAPLEAAAAKSLTDAGFKVRRNSDEDTYLYVHVVTASVSTGLCVSRYDVFLYTHTTATLSYQATPLLVQVSLLNEGGLAGGAPASHGDTVVKNVKAYVDEFATRIRNANR